MRPITVDCEKHNKINKVKNLYSSKKEISMKKLIIAAAALIALTGAANAQTVRIATEGAYAPYNFVDDTGKPAGFEIDLAAALCEKAAIECEIVTNDWDSIIPNLLAGNYDAIMAGMSITDERLQTIDFSQNYMLPDPSKFVTHSGSTLDFTKLTGAKIGVQSGTIQEAYAKANFATGNTIVAFGTADQAMADLAAGNLDTILADNAYLEPVVAASNDAIVFSGEPIMIGNGIGVGLRKGDTELASKFNAAIDALKADGTINTLITKWFEGKAPLFPA
jgi:polar amino acid transport system substrate-binding protein